MVLLSGCAVPWNVPTVDDRWQFTRGAFLQALAERPSIPLWLNHARISSLARDDDGTLQLWENAEGLAFLARLTSPAGEYLRDGLFGPLRGMSVQWRVRASHQIGAIEVVTAAALLEVSIITGRYRPRFPGTCISLRER